MNARCIVAMLALFPPIALGQGAAAASRPDVAPPLLEMIKQAPANTWIEVPNSPLLSVAPKPNEFPQTWGVCGPVSVVMAWCGAALDTNRERLVALGRQVQTAGTVVEARAALEQMPFDPLVSDIGLPDASGLELMRHAKSRYQLPGIALSGYRMDEDIRPRGCR